MKVSREETLRIAALARIELAEDELDAMAEDLSEILGFVEKINDLDTRNVPETDHSLNIQNVFRMDKPESNFSREDALAIGPETDQGHYVVPAIIE